MKKINSSTYASLVFNEAQKHRLNFWWMLPLTFPDEAIVGEYTDRLERVYALSDVYEEAPEGSFARTVRALSCWEFGDAQISELSGNPEDSALYFRVQSLADLSREILAEVKHRLQQEAASYAAEAAREAYEEAADNYVCSAPGAECGIELLDEEGWLDYEQTRAEKLGELKFVPSALDEDELPF